MLVPILTIAATVLTLLVSVWMAKKPFPVRIWMDIARIVIAVATIVAIGKYVGTGTPVALAAGGLAAGIVLGLVRGSRLEMWRTNDSVTSEGKAIAGRLFAQRNAIGIAIWLLGIIGTQIAGFANQSDIVKLGLAAAWLGLGTTIGLLVGRIRRQTSLGLSPALVAAVVPALILTAVIAGPLFASSNRAVAAPNQDPAPVTLGTGAVQVTLSWTGDADMDLHVIDTAAFEIFYSSPNSPSTGGQLDHDQIPNCANPERASENIFWEDGNAPAGTYAAFVRSFRGCGGAQSFVLEVRVDGQLVARDSGALSDKADSTHLTFTVAANNGATSLVEVGGGSNLDTNPEDVTGDGSRPTEVDEDGNVIDQDGNSLADDDITDEEADEASVAGAIGSIITLIGTLWETLTRRGVSPFSVRVTSTLAQAGPVTSLSEPSTQLPESPAASAQLDPKEPLPEGDQSAEVPVVQDAPSFVPPEQLAGPPEQHPRTTYQPGQVCRVQYGVPNFWVSTATRNLVVEDTVFGFRTAGEPIEITMTHNSSLAHSETPPGTFGKGWAFRYDAHIEVVADGHLRFHRGTGQITTFGVPDEDGLAWADDVQLLATDTHLRCTIAGVDYFFHPVSNGGAVYAIVSNGSQITINRDQHGRPNTITDAAGRTVTFSFGTDGFCSSMSLPGGRAASFTYSDGQLVQVIDAADIDTVYDYHGGMIASLSTNQGNKQQSFTYAPGSTQIVQTTAGNGETTTYGETPEGLTSVASSDGMVRTFQQHEGETVQILASDGRHLTTVHDAHAGTTSTTIGNRTKTDQYRDGALATSISGTGQVRTFADFALPDGAGTDSTDQLGSLGSIHLRKDQSTSNTRLTLTNPLGAASSVELDAHGRLLSLTSPQSERTEFAYDVVGNVVTSTFPQTGRTEFVYDTDLIDVMQIRDAAGRLTKLTWDGNRRLSSITDADGGVQEIQYSCCAATAEVSPAGRRTQSRHDDAVALTESVQPDGATWTQHRGHHPGQWITTDPLGQATALFVDPQSQSTTLTFPDGRSTAVSSTVAGNHVFRNDTLAFSSTSDSNVETITHPGGRQNTITRDIRGRITSTVFADGTWIQHTYDLDDQETTRHTSDGAVASFKYDADGQLLSGQNNSGTTEFAWTAGQVTGVRRNDTNVTTDDLDPTGRTVRRRYGMGLQVDYQYNGIGHVTGVTFPGGSVTINRDPDGVVTRIQRSNGVTTTNSHDQVGRVTSLQHQLTDEQVLASFTSRHDALGRITSSSSAFAPEHTPLSLAPATAAWTIDAADQLVTVGGHAATYDRAGALTEVAGQFRALYKPGSQLHEIHGADMSLVFQNDALGARAQVTHNGTTTDEFRDATGRLLFERTGHHTTAYIYVDGAPVASIADGAPTFYHFDGLGNTMLATDSAGSITGTWDYDPHGQITLGPESSLPRFGFAGEFGSTQETPDWIHMGVRYYHSGLARFAQPDPIGPMGGLNLYAYADNDPINYADPYGTSAASKIAELREYVQKYIRDTANDVGNRIIPNEALGRGLRHGPAVSRLPYWLQDEYRSRFVARAEYDARDAAQRGVRQVQAMAEYLVDGVGQAAVAVGAPVLGAYNTAIDAGKAVYEASNGEYLEAMKRAWAAFGDTTKETVSQVFGPRPPDPTPGHSPWITSGCPSGGAVDKSMGR